MRKIYQIKDQSDFEKVAFATLKKVYSPTILPSVLTNIQNGKFKKIFKKYAQIDAFLAKNMQNFAKNVHFSNYDIGLFFYQKPNYNKKTILTLQDLTSQNNKINDILFLEIFDGNGLFASSFVTNIFDDMFFCTDEQFLQKKSQIENQYKKLNKKNILVQ